MARVLPGGNGPTGWPGWWAWETGRVRKRLTGYPEEATAGSADRWPGAQIAQALHLGGSMVARIFRRILLGYSRRVL